MKNFFPSHVFTPKSMVLTATILTLSSGASAGTVASVGLSYVDYGGRMMLAGNPNTNKTVHASPFMPDAALGYEFFVNRYTKGGVYGFYQTKGGKATYDNAPDNYIGFERRQALGGVVKMGVVLRKTVWLYAQAGYKQATFLMQNFTGSTFAKKQVRKNGPLMGVGGSVQLTSKLALDLNYAYVSYGNVLNAGAGTAVGALPETYTIKMRENAVRLGVTYAFS